MQAAPRSTGVSAQDVLDLVRVHLDRVHDLVRRLGCSPREAAQVVSTSALDLVDVVASRPETVPDALGWWAARARALAGQVAQDPAAAPRGRGLLATDEDQLRIAEALERLPERDRVPLLLRDTYALPAGTVAAGVFAGSEADTDGAAALALVGQARLSLLRELADEPVPEAPPADEHNSLASLARLGEGGPLDPRHAGARRHALTCAWCRQVTDAQQHAHLLLAGLGLVALDERDHAATLAAVAERAALLLPAAAVVTKRTMAASTGERWIVPPALALAGIALALGAGVGVGLLLSRDAGAEPTPTPGSLAPGVVLASPSPLPSGPMSPPPTVAPTPPSTSVFVESSPVAAQVQPSSTP